MPTVNNRGRLFGLGLRLEPRACAERNEGRRNGRCNSTGRFF
jgi:hypothetical protein